MEVKIKADAFKYFSISKRTYLYDNVVIEQDDANIYPSDGVEVDNDRNVGLFR